MTKDDMPALPRRGLLRAAGIALATPALIVAGRRPAHAEDTWEAIRKRGTLNTVTEMQFAPWDMIVDGKYQGATKDQIDAVCADLGLKVAYNDLPWTGVLPGLEAKRFDICIAPVSATKERLKRYAFTIPIGQSATTLMKRADDTSITKPEDAAGKTIGAQKGTITVTNLKEFSDTLPKPIVIREFIDNNQSYNDLASGRIDMAAGGTTNLAYAVVKRPETFALVLPSVGKPTNSCWVARLDDTALVEAVNGALRKMSQDGRMAAIQKKWFGIATDLPQTLPDPIT